ncbi:MAG: protein O-mannosyl-transferase family [Cyclobacteriaceae bacterium]
MLTYKKLNDFIGWGIFAVSLVVYTLTVEETASFWDAGEFIAVSYKLEVPHPPGAPLFLLIGRLFSFLSFGNTEMVAFWINMVSVVSTAAAIMFLYWTITLLAHKILKVKLGEETPAQKIWIIGSGIVGALTCLFSDSIWFSATEAEVYGLSQFFTAFVFWAILKWENIQDEAAANRWLVLIAYTMGLSIGVHLLNLVTIPALGLIYYFHKHQPTTRGVITTLVISVAFILLILIGIIPGLPTIAGKIEVFSVNSIGLPFGSGFVIFGLLLIGGLVYGIRYSIQRKKPILNTFLLGLTFILIGYSSYSVVIIRSRYNPPIDENNPETFISFTSYLKREQYGSRPLAYGQYFTAELVDQKEGAPIYEKGEEEYVITDYKLENKYDPKKSTIFPRAYSTQGNHPELYRQWMNLRPNEEPKFFDNIGFFLRYQLGHMYMRYFMWNFAGRESDIKEAAWLRPWEGDSGIPEILANNKGRNQFYMLPLALGLVGLFFQYRRDVKSFSVVGVLFLLTGIGLVVYLNSPPVEPRERDYIYAGSFYAFAIWVGFGVLALSQFISQFVKNHRNAGLIAGAICLVVPGIMAAEGWDDHDRSNRYFSVDSAKNFLASCAPNAIIFTGGDNDTFPLWYAQEVEGFRTDVRVIVLSYFNTDWYIEQMTRPAYESEPLPFSLTREQYKQGGPNDYLPFVQNPQVKGAINLEQYLGLIQKNSPALKLQNARADYNTVPSQTFYLNVDLYDPSESAQTVSGSDSIPQELPEQLKEIVPVEMRDMVTDRLFFQMKGRGLEKKDLMILDLIANNKWERPIYFNNTSLLGTNLDFKQNVVQEGNAYRILPIVNPDPNNELVSLDIMYENMMENFHWRELDNPDVYYNEDYRNFALNHRSSFNSLARSLLEAGQTEKARKILNRSLEIMPDASIPYDYVSAQSLAMLYEVGEEEKATEMAQVMGDRADAMLTYLIKENRSKGYERQRQLVMLNEITRALQTAGKTELAQQYEQALMQHYNQINS